MEVHRKLLGFSEHKTPVAIRDCAIKRSREDDEEMDIFLNKKAKITLSTLHFTDETPSQPFAAQMTTIANLKEIRNNQQVTLKVKATRLMDVTTVTNRFNQQYTKRDVIISDNTASTKLYSGKMMSTSR